MSAGLYRRPWLAMLVLVASCRESPSEAPKNEPAKTPPRPPFAQPMDPRARSCENPIRLETAAPSVKVTAADLIEQDKGRYELVAMTAFSWSEDEDGYATEVHVEVDQFDQTMRPGQSGARSKLICHNQRVMVSTTKTVGADGKTKTTVTEGGPGISNKVDMAAAAWISLDDGTMGPMREVHFVLESGEPSWEARLSAKVPKTSFSEVDSIGKAPDENMAIVIERVNPDVFRLKVYFDQGGMKMWMLARYERGASPPS